MNKQSILRRLLLLFVSCSLGFAACTDDETESAVTLHYQQVGDIGPGMPYRGEAPTYSGATPSEFAIERITLDGAPFTDETPCFTINPSAGYLEIRDSELLSTGTYRFTLSCLAGGGRIVFEDILTVRMVPATPQNIIVTPSMIEADYDAERIAWATARVEAADEAVSFNAYALVQESGANYFTISQDGVISVNVKYDGEIPPGIYKPVLRLTTKAGSADYKDVLTIKVNSRPLAVSYERNPGTAEVAAAFVSDVPVLKGSMDEVRYELLAVTPSTDQFSIDPSTGVISLPEGHTLEANTSYEFSLAVSNKYSKGEAVALRGVYAVDVVPYIAPIEPETFSYPASTMTEFCRFEVEKNAGFVGDVVTFTLGELPAALEGQVAVDKQTGRITIERGSDIAVGDYTIPVIASNPKSDPENPIVANLALKVEANPNMFHKFGYGNNLGLPAEEHADQFRWEGDGKRANPVNVTINLNDGYNDFDGRKPVFKMDILHNWSLETDSKYNPTNNVDEDGNLHFTLRGDRWGQIGYVRVTATLGEGETAVSRSTVVFIMLRGANCGLIEYTPYVHRMHPRNGGYSPVVPRITMSDAERQKLLLSYRNNAFYIDFETEKKAIRMDPNASGQTDEWRNSWGYAIWSSFFAPGVNNSGSRIPFSYYGGSDTEFVNAKLAQTLGYIDPTHDFQVYINPNKWFAKGKYANGIFTFQANLSTEGTVEKMHSSSKKIGMAIWFDDNF